MSNRARRRNDRFREDSKPDSSERKIPKQNQRKIADDTIRPLIFFLILFVLSMYVVYTATGVQKYLFGSRALDKTKWWENSIVYQVYPRSFQDSDGDGLGDIKGIISRLQYFKDLGVDAIWLSPIYESPMVDFGYDVADFTEIDSIFGTMSDFNQLITEAHVIGLKIIMDLIPNHTSDKHWWFEQSRKAIKGAANPYRDYYIWHDGRKAKDGSRLPPNNWVSVFGGSMWTWDEYRNQYYLHQFTKEQPDLNFRNPNVRNEMENVIKFWLDKGVDGFRVDAVRHIYEAAELNKHERPSGLKGYSKDQYEYYNHSLTKNQPEVHGLLRSWRKILDEYEYKLDKNLFMVVEVFAEAGTEEQMPYYTSGAHMPFNFQLQKVNRTCDGKCVARLVYHWLQKMPEGAMANWVIGSHDVPRIADKMGEEFVNTMNMLMMLLPGVAITYYGEEIGMKGVKVSYEDTQDPFGINMGPEKYEMFSRDPCRSPMQWSYEPNAGFSSAEKTWLPVHPDYKDANVEVQLNDPTSHLNFYKRLAKLRHEIPFIKGDLDYAIVNEDIFSFIRFVNGATGYLVAANFGQAEKVENFRKYKGKFPPGQGFVPIKGYVVMNTHNDDIHSEVKENTFVQLSKVSLRPGQGLVIRFWPTF